MQNQQLFTEELFDADDEQHSNEVRILWGLAAGLVGRDCQGKLRAITEDDVKKWVNDPSVAL
jgi:hypothetical protein